jgi:DNA-binding response OmpR family regulator
MKAHRITVVDHDPAFLFIVHRLLLRLYPKSSVATFSNAEDALVHILDTGTEFLITGQFMRQMTGTDLICELRLRKCTTPIILISSNSLLKSEALDVGATEFLHKNTTPKVLEAHIRALVDEPQDKCSKPSVRVPRQNPKRPSSRPTRKLR